MLIQYKYLKSLEISSEFGKILPIDIEPRDNFSISRNDEIIYELKNYIEKKEEPDYLWLNLRSNSKVYLEFNDLISKIKKDFPSLKIGAYANSLLFQYEEIPRSLSLCDVIAINLNCVSSGKCSKICVFNENEKLTSQKMLKGIRDFKKNFKGYLSIYTILMGGINDSVEDIKALRDFFAELKPDQITLGELTGKGYKPISEEFKSFVENFYSDLPFEVSFNF
ncbi:MAG: hypothetical protein ACW98D_12285 [Promethearchaeota archaeon]|jgi:wyosine [tRNA(Phe)-imidazoG37] synthetase (radical SAM superfamily)